MMRLNLIPKRESARISCSQGDTTLRKWVFLIYNGAERWQIDADSVTFECSNGEEIPARIMANNTVSVDCRLPISNTAGHYRCKLRFVKGAEILHTQAFDLWVEGVSNGIN